jgi:hypothetical protein
MTVTEILSHKKNVPHLSEQLFFPSFPSFEDLGPDSASLAKSDFSFLGKRVFAVEIIDQNSILKQ